MKKMKCCKYGPCSFLLRISLISFLDILVSELESLSITRFIITGSLREQSLVNRTEPLEETYIIRPFVACERRYVECMMSLGMLSGIMLCHYAVCHYSVWHYVIYFS
jgi:hypothetical protein